MPHAIRPVRSLVGLAVLLAGGCSSAATEPAANTPRAPVVDVARVSVRACDGPASSLPAALAARLPPPPNPSAPTGRFTIDDYLSALARRTPGGFAGVFYDNGGTQPVLLLTDPSRTAEAKAALAGQVPNFDVAAAQVRAARWDFAQLYDWYGYVRQTQGIWAAGSGVTVTDIDERANRLYFGTVDAATRDRLAAVTELPCGLIVVGVSGTPMLL